MYVGVDLAWGERRPTGVAVLDSGGALVALASATSDDEIAAQVAPYVEGDCLVAIDAPLVVTNSRGNRPCEEALNRDFGRFERELIRPTPPSRSSPGFARRASRRAGSGSTWTRRRARGGGRSRSTRTRRRWRSSRCGAP